MTELRLRDYSGPAILSFGFRPFFLVGTTYSVFAVLFWLLAFFGLISIPTLFPPVDWHIHEMLFGYVPAVLAGFLLTAIPNWTGRLAVRGRPLALLLTLWIVGRLAISLSAFTGWELTLIIDNLFMTALVAAVANEIVAGKNWRNLKMLVPITLLLFANVGFHLEAHLFGSTDISRRLGFGAVVFLISLIGGRIISSFTRNWLARHNPGRMPVNFNRLDAAVIICSTISLAIWAFVPNGWITGTCLIIAGALHLIRLGRWEGVRA